MRTTVARIWFDSGLVETRPVEQVHLIDNDVDSMPDLDAMASSVRADKDVLIAFASKVQAIQLSEEEFTPRRAHNKRSHHHGSHQGHG